MQHSGYILRMAAWLIVGYTVWVIVTSLDGDYRRIGQYWLSGWLMAGLFAMAGADGAVVALIIGVSVAGSIVTAITSLRD